MVCNKCNSELADKATFCHVCGSKVNADKSPRRPISIKYAMAISILYGIALLTCFICDLALNKTLSWFYIVFVAVLMSFSITNLPFLLKKYRKVVPALLITLLTYALLFVCCEYVQGDWLFSFAYPIATYSLALGWLIFFSLAYMKVNWGYKIGIILFLTAIFTITCNPMMAWLSGEAFSFINLFVYDGGPVNYSGNGITFACLMGGAVISFIVGVSRSIKQKRSGE